MKKLFFYCLIIGTCISCNPTQQRVEDPTKQEYPPIEELDAFVYTETFDTIQIYNNSSNVFGYHHGMGNRMYNMLEAKLEQWTSSKELPTYVFYFITPNNTEERFLSGIYSSNATINKPWRISKTGRFTYSGEYDANYNPIILQEELASQCCMQIVRDGEKEHIKIWMEFENSEPKYRYVEFTKKIDLTKDEVGTAWECEWWKHCIQ